MNQVFKKSRRKICPNCAGINSPSIHKTTKLRWFRNLKFHDRVAGTH